MLFLKQSTACTVKIGPFIDNTDGITVLGGLTILQANIRVSKNGGNMAQKNDATSATHDELGYYDCVLDTTDTGTLGRLQVISSDASAMPVPPEYFEVVTANVYDTLFSIDTFDVNVASQANIDFGALQKASLNAATPAVTVSNKTGFSLAADQSAVTVGTVTTLTNKTDFSLSTAGVDAILDDVIEGAVTLRHSIRLLNSLVAGKSSGGGTASLVYRDLGDTKPRLTYTVDSSGNRSAVVADGT
jgi:hypothetical protein